jgi:outer membrane protein assembly factor BamB
MKHRAWSFLALAAGFLLCAPARASDWPNWRGPLHNGVSLETNWNSQWPAGGPKVLWRASVGIGFSSIAVANGRAYTAGNRQDADTLWCFDAATGSNLWKYSYACPVDANLYEGGPSATPTLDEGRAYMLSKKGGLYCLDAESGRIIWYSNVPIAISATPPIWGYSGSVLVQGDLLILNVGSHGAAVNKTNGALVWSTGTEMCGYSSPVPFDFTGIPAVAIMSAQTLYGVDVKSGRALWSRPWKTQYGLNISDPIVSGGQVFVSAGYDHGACVFQPGAVGRTIWENTSLRNHLNTSVLLDGFLYGVDGNVNSLGDGNLKCLDFATGAEKWSYNGLGGGALMVAGGNLIMLSDKGELVVAPASPQGFHPISRAQVLDAKCWTVPTLANGRIYCRNAKGDLVCLDVTMK